MIDTGGRYGIEPAKFAPQVLRNSNIVLFDARTQSTLSAVINIPKDTAFLVVAYEIPDGIKAVLNVVSVAAMDLPHACDTPCCVDIDATTPILHRMPMTLGGKAWEVSNVVPQMLIVLPNLYQLELSDASALGETVILGVPIVGVSTVLPFGYVAGLAGT